MDPELVSGSIVQQHPFAFGITQPRVRAWLATTAAGMN
jgi:hypothetical protein